MRTLDIVTALLLAAACGGKAKPAPAQPAPIANRLEPEAPPPAPSPPPPPDVASADSTGAPECDAYLALFDRLVLRCEKELGPAMDAMKQSQVAMREAFAQWKTLDEESRRTVIEAAGPACNSAVEALRQTATSLGCSLE